MDDRQRIIDEIKKAKLNVEFTDAEQSQIVLAFSGASHREVGGYSTTVPGVVQTTSHRVREGEGLVLIAGKTADKSRLLLSVSAEQRGSLRSRPVTKFAKAFIKAYKEANP